MNKTGYYFMANDEAVGPFPTQSAANRAAARHLVGRRAIALDRKSVRSYDADGHLHIARTPISKANICEYYGHEIPDSDQLGLEPNRKYRLLRDPKELAKAAGSSNGKQLMIKHVPVSADDHQPDLTVGALGTDAEYEHPYLYNSMTVHARDAIDGIEDESQKELSSAYRYRADMTPGTYMGQPYDGVMRDIDFNHVALVKEGRAGADVVVGDEKPQQKELQAMKTVLSRKALYMAGALSSYILPRLAQDSKLELAPLFNGVSAKNFKDKRAGIVAGLKAVKYANDADLEDITEFLDKLDKVDVPEGADADPSSGLPMNASEMEEAAKKKAAADKKAKDEKGKEFLKGKLSAEDMKAYDDMMGEAEEAEDGESERAEENEEGKEGGGGEDEEPKVTKKAMDAAIALATTRATENALKTANAIAEARDFVHPWTGRLAMDSTNVLDVLRAGAEAAGIADKVAHIKDPAALRTILELQPKPGDAARLALDSASAVDDVSGVNKRFAGLTDRIALS